MPWTRSCNNTPLPAAALRLRGFTGVNDNGMSSCARKTCRCLRLRSRLDRAGVPASPIKSGIVSPPDFIRAETPMSNDVRKGAFGGAEIEQPGDKHDDGDHNRDREQAQDGSLHTGDGAGVAKSAQRMRLPHRSSG